MVDISGFVCYIPDMVGIEALLYFADIHSELEAKFSERDGELDGIVIKMPVFNDGKICGTMTDMLIKNIPDAVGYPGPEQFKWPDDWWDHWHKGKRQMRDDFGPGILFNQHTRKTRCTFNGQDGLIRVAIDWDPVFIHAFIDMRDVNSAMLEDKFDVMRWKIEKWKRGLILASTKQLA